MLGIENRECLKLHIVGGAAPEEFLLWEFEPLIIANAHSDVVVGLDTAYSAPKK